MVRANERAIVWVEALKQDSKGVIAEQTCYCLWWCGPEFSLGGIINWLWTDEISFLILDLHMDYGFNSDLLTEFHMYKSVRTDSLKPWQAEFLAHYLHSLPQRSDFIRQVDYFVLQRGFHRRSSCRPRPLRPTVLQKDDAPIPAIVQVLTVVHSIQRQSLLDMVSWRRRYIFCQIHDAQ